MNISLLSHHYIQDDPVFRLSIIISIPLVHRDVQHMLEHMLQNILQRLSMHCCEARKQGPVCPFNHYYFQVKKRCNIRMLCCEVKAERNDVVAFHVHVYVEITLSV